MEWLQFISTGFSILFTAIAFGYLNHGASQIESKELVNGGVELRMNKLYQYLGYFLISLSAIFTFGLVCYLGTEIFMAAFLIFLILSGFSIPMLMVYNNHKILFNDEKIVVQNWRKKIQKISWTEITEIKFHFFSGNIKVHGLNKTLKIHQHLVGLKTFTNKMEAQTKWTTKDLKLPFQ